MKHTFVLLLFSIITQSVSQNIRTLRLSRINNVQYQCVDPGCSSPTIISVRNLRSCQIACLSDANCRTVTYDQSNSYCKMFADIPSQHGNIVPQANFVTLTTIGDRQLSAPMTTSTTTSTTTTTSSTTTSSTTSSSTTSTSSSSTTSSTSSTTTSSTTSSSTSSTTSSSTSSTTTSSSTTSSSTSSTTTSSSTTSSSTSSTTTSSTTSSTSSSSSTTSSTSPTTTSVTTTTTIAPCNSSCTNQTWSSSSNRLAQWSFDGSFRDQMNNYNATPTNNNMSFITNGYVRQAIVFSPNNNSMLVVPYIPLSSTSFTIDTWLYITGLLNIFDHGIFAYCSGVIAFKCLHLTIRLNGSNYHLYFGFYGSDCEGVTSLTLNTWIHAAFVFDAIILTQKIYLNGILENTCSVSSAITATPTNITIGFNPLQALSMTYYQGYMDQMTVSNRTKSSCEILEIATLVAYFTFDNGLFLNDSGPNSLDATTQLTSSYASGRFSQAISFTGSNSSYFQVSGFTAIGIPNKSFSISLWIRPVSLQGVLLHVSAYVNGSGWCIPFLGFNVNGSLVGQIYNGSNAPYVVDPTYSVSPSVWSHVVQTWSSINGIRLYINNVLVASRLISAATYTASSLINFITLANALNTLPTICIEGQVGSMPYQGAIDDFRVYSRELSTADICALYRT